MTVVENKASDVEKEATADNLKDTGDSEGKKEEAEGKSTDESVIQTPTFISYPFRKPKAIFSEGTRTPTIRFQYSKWRRS